MEIKLNIMYLCVAVSIKIKMNQIFIELLNKL